MTPADKALLEELKAKHVTAEELAQLLSIHRPTAVKVVQGLASLRGEYADRLRDYLAKLP